MKTRMRMFSLILAGSVTTAYASPGIETGSGGILAYLFVGFLALIVVTQLVPAMILFIGMVKGLFSRNKEPNASEVRVD